MAELRVDTYKNAATLCRARAKEERKISGGQLGNSSSNYMRLVIQGLYLSSSNFSRSKEALHDIQFIQCQTHKTQMQEVSLIQLPKPSKPAS